MDCAKALNAPLMLSTDCALQSIESLKQIRVSKADHSVVEIGCQVHRVSPASGPQVD